MNHILLLVLMSSMAHTAQALRTLTKCEATQGHVCADYSQPWCTRKNGQVIIRMLPDIVPKDVCVGVRVKSYTCSSNNFKLICADRSLAWSTPAVILSADCHCDPPDLPFPSASSLGFNQATTSEKNAIESQHSSWVDGEFVSGSSQHTLIDKPCPENIVAEIYSVVDNVPRSACVYFLDILSKWWYAVCIYTFVVYFLYFLYSYISLKQNKQHKHLNGKKFDDEEATYESKDEVVYVVAKIV